MHFTEHTITKRMFILEKYIPSMVLSALDHIVSHVVISLPSSEAFFMAWKEQQLALHIVTRKKDTGVSTAMHITQSSHKVVLFTLT